MILHKNFSKNIRIYLPPLALSFPFPCLGGGDGDDGGMASSAGSSSDSLKNLQEINMNLNNNRKRFIPVLWGLEWQCLILQLGEKVLARLTFMNICTPICAQHMNCY